MEEGGPVVGECVPGLVCGFIGAAEADEVWGDDTPAGRLAPSGVCEEDGDHVAVEIGPSWLAVEA